MRSRTTRTSLWLILLSVMPGPAHGEFDFDYFGLERPGMEKKPFNPRIEGLEDRNLGSIHFVPDGKYLFFYSAGVLCWIETRAVIPESLDGDRGIITVTGMERSECTCPLIDRKLTPVKACDCSLGWQQRTYETLLGKKVRAELKESVLRGGKRCVFEVHVLDQPLQQGGESPDTRNEKGA